MSTATPRSTSWGCSGPASGDRISPTISTAQAKRGEFLFSSISTTTLGTNQLHSIEQGSVPFVKMVSASKKLVTKKRAPLAQSLVESAFPTIPERVETPILSIITRRKDFTVFGLIS